METKRLDLKLPRGWNLCTTKQLEIVAEEIMAAQMQQQVSRFHPFDWTEVKTRLFFRLSEVQIVSQYVYDGDETDARYGNTTFVCRHPSLGRKETFELQTWQVQSFIAKHLSWLDAEGPMPKLLWPYPKLLYHLKWKHWLPTKEYYCPGQLLDGLSWQQYRLCNDWMEVYTNTSNALLSERQRRMADTPERRDRLTNLAHQQKKARTEVLRQLFYIDDPLSPIGYQSAPQKLLSRITDVQWQVIMFWYASMMQYLRERYPKCIQTCGGSKKGNKKPKHQPLPIELYTRSMATLQKYLGGITEAEINRLTAHTILQHLNDMAVEAEEMKKLKRKKH